RGFDRGPAEVELGSSQVGARGVQLGQETLLLEAEQVRRSQGMSEEESDQQYSFELELGDSVYEHRGTISFSDSEVDTTTGTIEVRALFPNPDGVLIPNQTVTVLIDVGDPVERPVVPRIALLRDRSGETVLVAKSDGTYERREVTLGPDVGRSVAVLDGIAEGDIVITEGHDRIRPGMLLDVEVVDPGAVAAQPAAGGN
ncbi:MAG: efflux RND transporter periplasmic adaptor subunit, partial [Planctomycetota bacterium]